ncbi:MFS transporter [Actinomadura kijaniata]|uniref:Putative MFS family arabinose efflux permease n=1 Tax=Actinomadura namibiensis TaxID=182080 RepID=A0A7W3LJ57_ACTNM|nr:MFS transporter [Actinomadura namibiensis]MBA8949144.1 putative MFS family arabinose efflux permease [Actinomadura namibiensis]
MIETDVRRTGKGTRPVGAVVAVAAAVIVAAGAFSTVPGLLVGPLHHEFGWSHGTAGAAMWASMALNGLVAPFAAALTERFGPRPVATAALAGLAAGAGLSAFMTAAWQYVLCWGVLAGLGTGALGGTFAAVVAHRWVQRRRGLAMGVLTAAGVVGQFGFLPLVAGVVERTQWRAGVGAVAVAALAVLPLAGFVLRDPPGGHGGGARPGAASVLRSAARTRTFWLLAGTFAICGMSTNGVMWTHFVAAAGDHGMAAPAAASVLSVIGVCNVAGTVASGWLTDRYDPRWLLAGYYALRSGALLALPALLGPQVRPSLVAFAVVFGVLDVATVPPTIALSAVRERFGEREGAVVFGWTLAAHQLGAGMMALAGGVVRDASGEYTPMWAGAGALCLVAAVMAAGLRRVPPGRITA